ncbi:hypothetical protein PI95_016890 [Hassallia byssoidea VB512170]|uniref:Uncharacterized protein n=1 Tax=Hassallia byssoidea VB512170 TaxID=1304833 RepID=A0A846HC83_9CYAN|nr:hypothetical protein [Hassalia byssoidea]NEU74190.1 hypothetical protein [Hassalia byssoidea VB512170]
MIPTVIAPHTPGASSRQSRRQVLQRREPPQRTASPTHWLPFIPSPQAGRGDEA